jgi:hypothetical protein
MFLMTINAIYAVRIQLKIKGIIAEYVKISIFAKSVILLGPSSISIVTFSSLISNRRFKTKRTVFYNCQRVKIWD